MKRDAAEDFARAEPFFSVLTAPKYLRANITPQAKEEFFAGGEAHVAAAMDFIRSRVDPHFVPQSILEYGCGPGRLAIPFAKRARRVVAVDRSPAMLQSAARFAAEIGVKNIEFRTTAELAASADRFDLVNCHLVLQRLPRAEGLALLRSLLERVANVGAFHLP
ncbi:MAG: class I SAM-dependent methyltransferase, partial [Thermoanaerobaculia bacterium]